MAKFILSHFKSMTISLLPSFWGCSYMYMLYIDQLLQNQKKKVNSLSGLNSLKQICCHQQCKKISSLRAVVIKEIIFRCACDQFSSPPPPLLLDNPYCLLCALISVQKPVEVRPENPFILFISYMYMYVQVMSM